MVGIIKAEKLGVNYLQRKRRPIKDKVWNIEIEIETWKRQSSQVKWSAKRYDWRT